VQFQVAANPNPVARLGDIALNDQHAAVTQAAAPCGYDLAPHTLALPAAGGPGTLNVISLAGCAWAASSQAAWVQVTSSPSGSGNGILNFTVAANAGAARIGSVTIAGQTFQVTQDAAPGPAPCTYSLDVTAQAFGSTGGAAATTVRSDPSCSWTAVSNVVWMSIAGAATGSGNGAVSINVAANTGSTRIGTATIAGQTFTVTQTGSCAASINQTGQSMTAAGGTGLPFTVTTATGCAWTATTADGWITITGGAAGNGNGTVTFTVAANAGPARTGTITAATQTFTVTQTNGCSYTIDAASQTIGAAGGAGTPVNVSTVAGCTWTASTTATWISLTSGANGNGNGTVNFTVAADTGVARTGTITIAGQTFTVTQTSGCSYTINPASQSIGAAGGAGTPVSVSTVAGCAWTASTAAPWISITSGASGSGNGTVNFTIAADTGPARTGTITIAGQTFTVTQGNGCSYAINPTSQSIGAAGGAGSAVSVTAIAGCTWTATTGDTWLTITAGASGSGNGGVNFTVAANTGPARTGTITIGGQAFTVTQASGCSYGINPSSQSMGAAGGAGTAVSVTTVGGCTWTATPVAAWLTVTSGASGTGNGTVNFTAAANTGPARNGTMTIANQTFTVTEASGCSYAINPNNQAVGKNGGTGFSVTVTAGAGCTWTATTTDAWLTITSGASGTGNGTVTFSAASNPGVARTGTITIAGLAFTVNQAHN
jgi:hypothetical protein